MLIQRKDECNKNIRDLGVLPEEAFNETTMSSDKVRCSFALGFKRETDETVGLQLLKKLRKVNEALKGFAHVNKKAYEYVSPSLPDHALP